VADHGTFQCSVVTPERAVLECEAKSVTLPAWDGEIGILRNRAPLVCRLGIGELRIETPSEKHTLFLDGGFAEMSDNRLTILTSAARLPEELTQEEIDANLETAKAIEVRDEVSLKAREAAQQRARVQRKMMHSS
jgi:F-type H+-transporting ATPase subunit epsilon